MLASLSPALRRVVLAATALLLVLGVVLVVLPTTGSRPRAGTAVDQDVAGPVVVVPGYGGSVRSFDVLAARLRADGREVVGVEPPGDGRGDLHATAAALEAVVADLEAHGAPPVDVVGYSAGGVVARLWVAEQGEGRVRRVVTLGSPHHGAALAACASALVPGAYPPGCAQLRPGSELLSRLNVGDETPEGPHWVALWSAQDDVVRPPGSGRLEGAVTVRLQDVCPDAVLRHGDLASDPLPVGVVVDALQGAPLDDVPPSSACDALQTLGAPAP